MMFRTLLDHAGVQERCDLGSRFGFMAFHGGSLEEQTDQIALAAAERSGSSLYAVVQPADLRWHIPSTAVRPAESPALRRFLDHVDAVVAVHGFGRDGYWTSLLLGGRGRGLASHLAGCLRPALPDYEVIDDLEAIPAGLRGVHPDNPVNLGGGEGVQLELPPRVRGMGPFWKDHPVDEAVPHTEALIGALATAARSFTAPSAR
jgi:phage replication-related protein YjqB (UPF0714/DUF867 family)